MNGAAERAFVPIIAELTQIHTLTRLTLAQAGDSSSIVRALQALASLVRLGSDQIAAIVKQKKAHIAARPETAASLPLLLDPCWPQARADVRARAANCSQC